MNKMWRKTMTGIPTDLDERVKRAVTKSLVLFISLGLLTLGTTNASAAAKYARVAGNWDTVGTWSSASCAAAGATTIPTNADAVTICGGVTITVAAPAVAASIVTTAATTAANGITISGTNSLTVTGAVTLTSPTGSFTTTLDVGAGTLSAASLSITGGTGSRVSLVTVSTGTITTTGNITLAGTAANARFTSTGVSTVNVGGNFTSGGTLTTSGTGTINFNGAAAQTIGAYTTYNNITINKSAGAATPTGAMTVGGVLNVTGGTFNVGASNFIVTGATNIGSGAIIDQTNTGGTAVFTGLVTIDGTWNNTSNESVTYAGGITNNGSFTGGTAAQIFTTNAQALNCASPMSIPSITVTTIALTNNCNLTVATALSGTGTFINAASAQLHVADPGALGITTLTASATGNLVEYNYAGAQTVKATTYHHLTLSGSGAKTLTSVSTINGNLTLSGSATATTATAFAIGGNLSVGSGTTFTSANFTNLVSGTTSVSGTLAHSGAAAKTYTGDVTINSSGSWTNAGNPPITFSGNFTNAGAYTGGSGAVALGGNFTNSGTFTSGSGTWTFQGASQQYITGTPTFQNLILNNSSGLTLMSGSVTVSTALTLTSGIVATNGYTLINSSATCSTTRTNGWVNGLLRLVIPATNPVTCVYPVGDSLNYVPISITKTGTNTGTLIGSTTSGDHADTVAGASGVDKAKSVNRFWTLTAGTLTAGTPYSATFNFVAGDVDSGATTANFIVAIKATGGATWATQIAGTKAATSTQATGITSFGDFAIGEALVSTCYTESFTGADGSAPGNNWSVGSKTGAFGSPAIYNNRLRLTDASGAVATWATLQRLIPASGNKATIFFDYYGYDGTGADGVAVILSDASIAPAAGAFGGSLGYAPKSNPGSDCTTTGGCVGFAGGWLGIGFDEYGNYQNPTEGRYGGPGAVANSVAIRGSGSGMSGYRFLVGTAALSPTVDSAAALSPPDNYSIVVDHTDGVHAYTSVTRRVSGSSTYTTLLGCPPGVTTGCTVLDVKDPGYSQNAVPVNWNLSFTGSTGGSTNIHEIDNLNICTAQGLVTPTLHHIQVTHGGTACTGAASPASVTIKACADAACTSLYQNSVTVTLTSAPGGTWSPVSPITFTGGSATVTLSDATTRTDTLTATATLPTASSATVYSPGQTLVFSACVFDVIEVGAVANTPIYTKLAGTPFDLKVLSLSGVAQTVTAIDLVDMSSGSCATPAAVLSPVTLSPLLSASGVPAFTANQSKTFTFTYANAAPNVRVRVKTSTTTSCSSDNFAIRPTTFTLTALNAANVALSTSLLTTATPTAKAGVGFALQANSGQSAYIGTPKLNASLLQKGLPVTQALGTLTNVSFAQASAGVATASGLTYSEAGNFVFGIDTVYDDSFTAVDSTKASPECTSDFSNALSNSRYGCMFGNTAVLNVGRFVPDHFDTVVVQTGTSPALVPMSCASTLTCPSLFNGMVYSGQPFKLTVTAKNAGSATTLNYDTTLGFAKTTTLSVLGALGTSTAVTGAGTLGVTSPATFTSGVATEAAEKYTFTTTPTAPTDIYIRAIDTDAVSSLRATNPTTTSVEGGVKVVSGRIKVPNAYGSDLLPLTLTAAVQFYNAAGSWVTSLTDSATALAFPATYTVGTGTTAVTLTPATGIVSAGILSIKLGKPTAGGGKTPAITPTTKPSYLPAVDGQATFGVYKGNSSFIYMRESY